MPAKAKVVYTIQQTPKSEWHLKKNGTTLGFFPDENKALGAMVITARNTIKSYDENGKFVEVTGKEI